MKSKIVVISVFKNSYINLYVLHFATTQISVRAGVRQTPLKFFNIQTPDWQELPPPAAIKTYWRTNWMKRPTRLSWASLTSSETCYWVMMKRATESWHHETWLDGEKKNTVYWQRISGEAEPKWSLLRWQHPTAETSADLDPTVKSHYTG